MQELIPSFVVNGRFLCSPRPTGTQRSAYFLLNAINEISNDLLVACPGPVRFPIALSESLSSKVIISRLVHPHIWEQLFFPRIQPNAWHLNLMGTSSALIGADRNVCLIHDLNYDLLPGTFNWKFRVWYKFACAFAAKRATQLICNSNYTRSIIGRFLGKEIASRTKVLRFGPGIDPRLLISADPITKEDFILCVGSLQPHKNLVNILQAFAIVRRRFPILKLKIVGKRQNFFNSEQIPHDLLCQPKVEFSGYIDDHQLASLYQRAKAFVYPSIEEGFGLPIIEAFYAKCPVVTSNTSCMPEVAGDGAMLVDPSSRDQIATAITRILTEPALSNELISNAWKRTAFYSWRNAAEDFIEASLHLNTIRNGEKFIS